MPEPAMHPTPRGDEMRAPIVFRGELEFRRLLDKLPAAAYTCNADGLITYYNRHAAEIWGRLPKICDPEDRFCGSFRLWWPDGSPMAHEQCWMAQALNRGEAFDGHEVVIERADGRRITALAHANPIRDDSGTLLGAVNVLIDITDRKCAEQVLKDADRAKDEFLATLAHELRNPLAPIKNALEIMKHADGDAAAVTNARAMIERQVEHMMRLVDDLLDVSRITGNKLQLRRERLELAAVIESAVESSRPAIEAQGSTLEVDLPAEPILLDADPVRLTQVFLNLLDNAAKHGRPGGRIWLEAERRRHQVVIGIRDDGRGIPEDMLAKIFEPFAQLDHSLERKHAGLGIGLMLVRKLVELHGGSVEAHSPGLGRGSRFVVRLNVADAVELRSVAPPAAVAERPRAPRRRVLVVDDNRDSATSLATLLGLTGDEAHVAHDGRAALAAAAELRPDVILLDIAMPELNGYEAARRIREQPWGRNVVLIALTGYGQAEDVRRSRQAGMDHHLVKPVKLSELLELLSSLGTAQRPDQVH